jgi:hypothetical protein
MSLSRRFFLGGLTVAPLARAGYDAATGTPEQRRNMALQIRENVATFENTLPIPAHPVNGDEQRYPSYIANFSKGLPHNDRGEVDPQAYGQLLAALGSGHWSDFEAITMGCPDVAKRRKFTNPEAGAAFNLVGADSQQLAIPPAPSLASAEQAAEAVELYWKALARDVPFTQYDSDPITQAAAADLSKLSDFRGQKSGGKVTTATLFRGVTPGDVIGPYLSQFLLKPVAYGPQLIDQSVRPAVAGVDYLTDFASWLQIQNGFQPGKSDQSSSMATFVRTGRDLANWVHNDVLFQAGLNAINVVLDAASGGKMPVNPSNPYVTSLTQDGFGTLGDPYFAAMVPEVAAIALKAVWFQKWYVHRRLRPEAFGGLVHNRLANKIAYPLHNDVLNSDAMAAVFKKNGSYLLPQAFPEGSPLHPSYGAGHATVAGASVTILKALFDESYVIPQPVVPSADGRTLVPYTGPDADRLTVGGELNKLAANVAMGRNFGGIHWRTDYSSSIFLGEELAIRMLMDLKFTYNEDFDGFTFTKFDGTQITV